MARARIRIILAVAAFWLFAPFGHAGITPPLAQPSWAELSLEQKQILAPLAKEWDKMDGFRRKKWLGIAKRYRSMKDGERTRMQHRMTDWAKLSPDERNRARDKYKSLQKAPPAKKDSVKAKWQEYKALPESEKVRLKAEAARKKASLASKSKKPNSSTSAIAGKNSIPNVRTGQTAPR